jgi:hypothetical protein
VRRARIILEREWDFSSVLIELNGDSTNGPNFGLYRAEASLVYRGGNDRLVPPLFQFTLGQFRSPFGGEQLESPRTRYFMERSTLAQAFFPTEIEAGLRVSGGFEWFRYSVALTNGEPLGAKTFQLQSPTAPQDATVRVGGDIKHSDFGLNFGFSALVGRGFHAGAVATKNTLSWSDLNGDNTFESNEVVGNIGQASTPSATFKRFAFEFDGDVRFKFNDVGWLDLFGGAYVGSNMDQALYVADPLARSPAADFREYGFYAGFTQEIGLGKLESKIGHGVIGLRVDFYNPDQDLFEQSGSNLAAQVDETIYTISPLIGWVLPHSGRLVFQYDHIQDHFARNSAGQPCDLKNDAMTVRLQVEL